MILHRLASAIRHQNWSQIITEILIVIIGIFLGLQVQGWYEERQERVQEQILLASLAEEIQININQVKRSILQVEGKALASRTIIQIAAGEMTGENIDELIGELTWWLSPDLSTATLDSYLLGGNRAIIENVELRNELQTLPGKLDTLESLRVQDYETYQNGLLPLLRTKSYLAQISNSLLGRPGDRGAIVYDNVPLVSDLVVDNSQLLKDREFMGIIVNVEWDQKDIIGPLNDLLNDLINILALVQMQMEENE